MAAAESALGGLLTQNRRPSPGSPAPEYILYKKKNKTSMCARGRRGPVLFHKPSYGSGTPPPTPLQVYSPQSLDGRGWAGRSSPTELPENGRVRSRTSRLGPPKQGKRTKIESREVRAGPARPTCLRGSSTCAEAAAVRSAPRSPPGRLAEGQAPQSPQEARHDV